MGEPFLGEITMFAGNFNPRGWAKCDGQLLPISQYDALFSLLGTIYGGDGRTTFGLPECRGRVPTGAGNGPGLVPITLGQKGGAETHVVTQQQMPSHAHSYTPQSNSNAGNNGDPSGSYPANTGAKLNYSSATDGTMASSATSNAGGSQPISLLQPYLAVNYIIALVGIYPSRN